MINNAANKALARLYNQINKYEREKKDFKGNKKNWIIICFSLKYYFKM
jgi:hypothetical protein